MPTRRWVAADLDRVDAGSGPLHLAAQSLAFFADLSHVLTTPLPVGQLGTMNLNVPEKRSMGKTEGKQKDNIDVEARLGFHMQIAQSTSSN